MPHIEIKYSNNLTLNTNKIFNEIEKTINTHDNKAGECKARAYPCNEYKYTHIITSISLLPKEHRDKIFTENLSLDIEKIIKSHLNQSAYFTLNIEYSNEHYITNMHSVEGDKLEGIS